jgi:hypothetical protein
VRAPGSERRATRRGTACALAALTLAAGCGGSDGSAKADYVAQGNRICRAGSQAAADVARRIAAAQRGSDPDAVVRALAGLTDEAVAAAQPVLDLLAALPPPSGDEDELKGWLADERRRQSLRRALADAFAARDETAISRLSQRIAALGTRTAAFANRYGLGTCARAAG